MNRTTKEFDIVVLGAGPAGLAAAIAAARNGAKVLLADKNGYLGGNMTLGLPLLGFLDKDKKKSQEHADAAAEAMEEVESEPVMRLKQRKRHRPSRLEEPEKVYYKIGDRNNLKRRQVPKKNRGI